MKMFRKTSRLFLLFGLCLLLSSCREAESSYQTGVSQYQAGKYEDAEQSFLLSISQGMKDAKVRAELALTELKLGNKDQAAEYLQEALEQAPEESAVLKRAGMYYDLLGEDETALSYYESSLTTAEDNMSTEDLETCAFAAAIEKENGNYDEAIRLYNLLIEGQYYPVEHEIMTGECYLAMNQIEAACQYFDIVTKNEGVNPKYYLLIYYALYDAGAYTKAENYFEKGLDSCSTDEDGMTQAAYYESVGKYTAASVLFETETSVSGLLAKAKCLQESGDFDGAEEIYTELLSRDEDPELVYSRFFTFRVITGDYDDAERLLTKIRLFHDERVLKESLWNEVIMYEKQLDFETAYEKLSEYLSTYNGSTSMERELRFLERAVING